VRHGEVVAVLAVAVSPGHSTDVVAVEAAARIPTYCQ
jgi:uridylate kinase